MFSKLCYILMNFCPIFCIIPFPVVCVTVYFDGLCDPSQNCKCAIMQRTNQYRCGEVWKLITFLLMAGILYLLHPNSVSAIA